MDYMGINTSLQSGRTGAQAAAASSLQNSVKKLSKDSSEEELKGVINDFESYFVEQVIKKMKDTFTSDDDKDPTMAQYEDLFMDKAIEQVADQIVEQTGENFTQQLYEQMRRNMNIE